MNLEEKFLNAAAADLIPDEGDPNFRGPVPPAAKLEAPVGEYVLTPDTPEAAADVAARVATGRGTAASVVGKQVPPTQPAPATMPTAGRVFPEDTASIQNIPRNTLQEIMGTIGSAIQSGAEVIDFDVIGLPNVGTLTLKDLTVGDLGKVMEAMSYGFTPTTGAGETLRPTPEALDLLNAIPAFKAASSALKYGARELAPAAANMIEEGLRKSGMIMDIVPDGKSVAQQAAKSDIGFYSAVENAAINVQRKSGTGQSFLNDIMKGENVKAEEIKWMGLDEFLKSKKNVTKQEVQDYIANNKVDVQEVALGGKQKPFIDTENAIEYIAKEYNMTPSEVRAHWAYTDENDYVDLANQSILNGKTRFDSYTLAGGENYREILLTMPDKRPTVFTVQADSLTKEFNTMDEANAYKNSLMQQYPNSSPNIIQNKSLSPDDANYKSTHFPDQRNILAHLRVNDRVDADGKKMLLVEEVQSDWHQAGRDKGYKSEAKDEYFRQIELEKKFDAKTISPTEQIELENLVRRRAATPLTNRVPDAPFKDTWYQLALKRALQYAAENGYERVGLTTGKQQVDRFDLSKQVNAISYHPDDQGRGMMLNVFGKNNEVIYSKITPENEVANVIGKETAKKLIETKPIDDSRVLQGLDLQVGGEGMKKYYDEIYPKFLEKYGKKWNAKMGATQLNGTLSKDELAKKLTGNPTELYKYLPSEDKRRVDQMFLKDGESVRYIDITPEMKAGVQKGQPLFAAAPIGAATGTAAMQDERKK